MPEDDLTEEELEALMQALNEDEGDAKDTAQPLEAEDPDVEPLVAHDEPMGTQAYMAEPDMSVGSFFDSWALFGDAALAGAFSGALLGTLGVYIILKRMVFLSASLSQAASLGIVLAFFIQASLGWAWLHPMLGAGVMTFAALMMLSSRMVEQPGVRDSALGLVYVFGAAGTLILGTRIVEELHDVQTILFGSAVAVVPQDFWLICGVSVVLGAIHVAGWRGFTAVVMDPEDSAVRGLPVRTLDVVLLVTIAVAVAISTAVLGALPTFAFSVLPAMIALRLVANVQRALLLAGILGAAIGFLGYVAAFVYELPVGAAQAMVGVVIVLLGALYQLVRSLRT